MPGDPQSLPLQAGDRVALLVPGSAAYLDAVISLLVRGIVPIPLDPRLTEAERVSILADLDPTAIVTDSAGLAAVTTSWRPGDLPLARPMHVTSGTTGAPKGVFSGVLSPPDAAALVTEERDAWGFAATDINLVLSPLYHSAPLRFAVGTLLAGGQVLLPVTSGTGFDAAAVTATISDARPTTMFCVPAHLHRLFTYWDATGWPDLTSFRLVAHAGAPCPDPLKRRLIEAFPPGSTWEFYGATEGQFTACRSEEWQARPGTVGRARPGRRLRTDEDGLIWCTVPTHARFSYYGAPDKTAAAWRGDAFTVGDHGRLDEDGYLYLDGRREDLIITGGVNVYPAEIENALSEHPGVDEVAVYGLPDEDWGQRVCAAYVGAVAVEDLRTWAAGRLSPPKRPKQYVALDAIPRTLTGKILRRELIRPDS